MHSGCNQINVTKQDGEEKSKLAGFHLPNALEAGDRGDSFLIIIYVP